MGPLIGVTAEPPNPAGDLRGAYSEAVVEADGVPILLPLGLDIPAFRRLFEGLDAILLTGGGDIAPEHYGERPSPALREVDPGRDLLEITLARWALERDKPILGICRGLQVINVALGGTLIQDIAAEVPGALPHDNPDTRGAEIAHRVEVEPGSALRGLARRANLETNSSHHQAVRRLAYGLAAVARSGDGIVEALEAPGHRYAVAVQWHPERLPGRPESRALFAGLTRAAGRG